KTAPTNRVRPAAATVASANVWHLSGAQNDAFIVVNRLLQANQIVPRNAERAWVIPATGGSRPIVQRAAQELGLSFTSGNNAGATAVRAMRIGLWDRYGGSMPSGWTRWLLEQYEFPFSVVYPQELDAGNLNAKY